MVNVMVQLSVKDYTAWRKVFDEVAGLRKTNGSLSEQVFTDASDPHKVVILYQWNSLETGKSFFQSAELKAAQQRAGVEGANFTYLKEA
jgi:quinol monooxygenase YgiN